MFSTYNSEESKFTAISKLLPGIRAPAFFLILMDINYSCRFTGWLIPIKFLILIPSRNALNGAAYRRLCEQTYRLVNYC
jgi:hypothetical protein